MEVAIPLLVLFFGEIGAYFWHRFIAHSFGPVGDTHDIHHKIIEDKADGDFLWVLLMLFVFLIFLYLLWVKNILSMKLCLLIYIPLFLLFSWNWYIHRCYHVENHWLNRYHWFVKDKKIHMKHHLQDNKNYGISTHFCDQILDTFSNPYPIDGV